MDRRREAGGRSKGGPVAKLGRILAELRTVEMSTGKEFAAAHVSAHNLLLEGLSLCFLDEAGLGTDLYGTHADVSALTDLGQDLRRRFVFVPCELRPPESPRHLTPAILADVYETFLDPRPSGEGRARGGVFYTPAPVIDFINQAALDEWRDGRSARGPGQLRVCDPACGCGSFLVRMLFLLQRLSGESRADIAGRCLYGVDKSEAALQIAHTRLKLAVASDDKPGGLSPALRLGAGDSLLGVGGGADGFPWRTEFRSVFEGTDPGFDVIIGNPPYVRQEHLAASGSTKYKQRLEAVAGKVCPQLFERGDRISARSDLQLYFFLLCPTLLAPEGVLSFISSDSWLDAEYGRSLRTFLSRKVTLRKVISSRAGRAFPGAGVGAVITVLRGDRPSKEDGSVQFIELEGPFDNEEAEPGSTEGRRVRKVATRTLASNADGHAKWGARYLRMPAPLAGLEGLLPLPDLADLTYGSKPGIARFFIPPAGTLEAAGVEDQFLIPILSSTRFFHTFKLDGSCVGRKAFVCREALADLERRGLSGAAAYVRTGASRTTARGAKHTVSGVPWPLAKSVRGNLPEWHCFTPRKPGDFVVPCLLDKRLFFAWNPESLPATNMFFQGRFHEGISPRFGCGLLNSSLVYLMLEVFGRPKGLGGLNLYGPDLAEVLVPDPGLFNSAARTRIEDAFDALCRRPILSIFEEVESADRRRLDNLVFDALDLAQEARTLIPVELARLTAQRLRLGRG